MKVTSLALLLLPACTAGFFFNNNLLRPPTAPKVSSDEERAAAMSQYLAKAHEEKLRAVKAAEDKKQEEIRLLKEEIAALKASKSPVISSPPPGPMGELAKYQEFMKTYIVNAHQQKVDAIKAAEAALNKRWEEKMAEFGFVAPSRTAAPSGDNMLKPKVVDVLIAARNEAIKAAASEGKSRWGESEVHKVKAGAEMGSFVKSNVPATLSAAPRGPAIAFTPGEAITQTPEILAADHGLRADGGVGGPTLAERVVLGPNIGAQVAAGVTSVAPRASSLTLEERLAGGVNIGARIVGGISTTAAPVSAAVHDSSFYQMRNSKVLQEAGAGKSRWGSQEVERVRKLPVYEAPMSGKSTVPVPPEVEAADHGLRADGGVGGPTLAERIAFGANIGAKIVAQTTSSSADLYAKRNAQVAAAAAAGKSRWGSQEVAKVADTKKIDSVEIVNSHHEDIFEQRNHKVLAESAAGKSRWGKEEVSRLQMHSGSSKGFPARVNGSVVGV